MNKKLTLIIMLIICLVPCLYSKKKQDYVLTEKDLQIVNVTTLQIVIKTSLTKQEIFENLELWIDKVFISEKSIDIKKDAEKGIITGFGDTSYTYKVKNKKKDYLRKIYFKYLFEIKDNKIRFTIKDIYELGSFYSEEAGVSEIKRDLTGKEVLTHISYHLSQAGFLDNLKAGIENSESDW